VAADKRRKDNGQQVDLDLVDYIRGSTGAMTIVIRYPLLVSDSFDIRQTGNALDPQWIGTPSEMKKQRSPHINGERQMPCQIPFHGTELMHDSEKNKPYIPCTPYTERALLIFEKQNYSWHQWNWRVKVSLPHHNGLRGVANLAKSIPSWKTK
jgi:hypothetical protein